MKYGRIPGIVFILFIFAHLNNLSAQNPTKLVTGFTISSFYNSGSSAHSGYTIGIHKESRIRTSELYIGFGANFTQRGGKVKPIASIYDENDQNNPYARIYSCEYDIAVNYLELPIFLKRKYPLQHNFYYSFFLGASFSFALFDVSEIIDETYIGPNETTPWELERYSEGTYVKNDYGFFGGAELGYGRISIEVSYYIGFNTLNSAGTTGGFNLKTNGLNILILMSI